MTQIHKLKQEHSYLAELGGSYCMTQLTSGMSIPRAMTSVHTSKPLGKNDVSYNCQLTGCIFIHIHTHIYIHTHTCTHTHTHQGACIHPYTYLHKNTSTHKYTHHKQTYASVQLARKHTLTTPTTPYPLTHIYTLK